MYNCTRAQKVKEKPGVAYKPRATELGRMRQDYSRDFKATLGSIANMRPVRDTQQDSVSIKANK